MTNVHGNPIQEAFETERIIEYLSHKKDGPTVVFFGGVHGNEPAGIVALRRAIQQLKAEQTPIYGEVYAVAGNLGALKKQVRFQKEDLNRIWSEAKIHSALQKDGECTADEYELKQVYTLLGEILKKGQPPFYFFDLHTTSSPTNPFVVLNDSLLNRKFASNYPLPIILGIEEYVTDALLSFINELGYVSLGFESGQHDDPFAVKHAIDFILYTLMITETVNQTSSQVRKAREKLKASVKTPNRFYEIYYQYAIKLGVNFKMLPGFTNFQTVPKGRRLAAVNGNFVTTEHKIQVFMPLYQDQGSEGFYFIRPIPKVLLWISKGLRTFKADHLLVKLPGVQWRSAKKDTMLVNLRIARFLAKPILHLLGYRARQFNDTHLIVKNREAASRNKEYEHTAWYK